MDLQQKIETRTRFMRWLYDETGGDTDEGVESNQFLLKPESAGISEEDLVTTVQYLEGEYLLRAHRTYGVQPPMVQVQHAGVVEVEQAMLAPDRATQHFAPLISVMHVSGSIIGSQVTNGSPGAQQVGTFNVKGTDVREFIDAARLLVQELEIGESVKAEVLSDLTAMETELGRDEPRSGVVREFGKSVRAVLEQAVGGLAATAANPSVMRAIEAISAIDF